MFIEVLIVLAWVKSSVLLLNEEEWRGLWRLGFTDFSGPEMFVNELLASIHLFRVWQVGLGYLGNKSILEFYGMIERLLRRKFPCFGFIKYLGIPRILGRKFLFDFLYSLGKGSRQSEFLDVGVTFPKFPPVSFHLFLLLADCSSVFEIFLLASSQVSHEVSLFDHLWFIMSRDWGPDHVNLSSSPVNLGVVSCQPGMSQDYVVLSSQIQHEEVLENCSSLDSEMELDLVVNHPS